MGAEVLPLFGKVNQREGAMQDLGIHHLWLPEAGGNPSTFIMIPFSLFSNMVYAPWG
jgi:hypothetical protein